jgi:concentrative nucleoside transporter, CNT family
MQNLQSALGVAAIIAIAWSISENRRAVPWRVVITGLAITFVLALLMLKVPQTQAAFDAINRAVGAIADATKAGTSFVFGYVGGGPLPFAFQALPVVLVMSVLSSLLFYWRIMPPIVRGFSWRWSGRSMSAAPSGCRRRPTFLSARSRRRCSSGPICHSSRAVKCSW